MSVASRIFFCVLDLRPASSAVLYIRPPAWGSNIASCIPYLVSFAYNVPWVFIHRSLASFFPPNMADRLTFLLFGDQSLDTHAFLSGVYRARNQGILTKAFLHQAGDALRNEMETLGRLARSTLPEFQTLQQLNEKYHAQDRKHPGLDGALLCITQLAHYIECVYRLSSFPLHFPPFPFLQLTR